MHVHRSLFENTNLPQNNVSCTVTTQDNLLDS